MKNLMILVLLGVGYLVVSFQLSGCTPAEISLEPPAAAAEGQTISSQTDVLVSSGTRTELTIADRISFQDRLSENNLAASGNEAEKGQPQAMTMADRISFQDRLSGKGQLQTTTMADRIRFHDRLSI